MAGRGLSLCPALQPHGIPAGAAERFRAGPRAEQEITTGRLHWLMREKLDVQVFCQQRGEALPQIEPEVNEYRPGSSGKKLRVGIL